MEETSTSKYLSFKGVDVDALAKSLNDFVEAGGTIESVSIAVDKIAYALVLGTEPPEEDTED